MSETVSIMLSITAIVISLASMVASYLINRRMRRELNRR